MNISLFICELSLSFLISFFIFLLFIIKVKNIYNNYNYNSRKKIALRSDLTKKSLHLLCLLIFIILFSILKITYSFSAYQAGFFLGISLGIIEGIFYDKSI